MTKDKKYPTKKRKGKKKVINNFNKPLKELSNQTSPNFMSRKEDSVTKGEDLNLESNKISDIKGLKELLNVKRFKFNQIQIGEAKDLENLSNLQDLNLEKSNLIAEIKGLEYLLKAMEQEDFGSQISNEIYGDFLELPIPKNSERMIKVYDYKFLKGKLSGYVEGKCYFDDQYREIAILKGNTIDFGNEVHALRDDNVITVKYKVDEDNKTHEAGYLKDDVIYAKHGFFANSNGKDSFLVKISKENGEFYDKEGKLLLRLEGDYDSLDFIDFIGIALYYLELFI